MNQTFTPTLFGVDPNGNPTVLRVSSNKFTSIVPLLANTSVTTGWIDTSGYSSVSFILYSDKGGNYTIEWTSDMAVDPPILPIVPIDYTALGVVNSRRKGGVDPDLRYFRLTFNNGNQSQTKFTMNVNLNTGLTQPSLESLSGKGSPTRLAQWSKTDIQLVDTTGSTWDNVMRTGNSMNVNVTNQNDISGIAKDSTLNTIINNLTALGKDSSLVSVISAINTTNNKDFATQTTLAAVLAKLTNDPATQTTLLALLNTFVNGTAKTKVVEIPSLPAGINNIGKVTVEPDLANPLPVIGQFYPTTQQVAGTVSVSNFPSTQSVSAISLPLPTGASTSILQTTGNTSLNNIDVNTGSKTDAIATDSTSSWSIVSLLKYIASLLKIGSDAYANKYYYQSIGSTTAISNYTLVIAGIKIIGNISIYNNTSAAKTIMFYDKASTPTSSDIPVHAYIVAANSQIVFPLSAKGVKYLNGIGFSIATSVNLLNLLAGTLNAGDITINIDYN